MNIKRKPKVVILVAYYIPAFKAGGPIRSIAGIVNNLSDELDFFIITKDRDSGDSKSFNNIKLGDWNETENARIYYLKPSERSFIFLKRLIESIDYDVLYLNSFFSTTFSIKPLILRKLKLIKSRPVILAPRGELSRGALNIRKYKKTIYIVLCKLVGLHRGVVWHASNESEKHEIQRLIYKNATIHIAPNLSAIKLNKTSGKNIPRKYMGELKLIYISRVNRKKNLLYALECLLNLDENIQYDIYGYIDDYQYWKSCRSFLSKLPSNINVDYKGIIDNDDVINTLNNYHLLFLPTQGENFGHIILESFLAGCPVLISDQTPWQNLEEKKAGWSIPLLKIERFREILKICANMNHDEFSKLRKSAYKFGEKIYKDKNVLLSNKKLFLNYLEK